MGHNPVGHYDTMVNMSREDRQHKLKRDHYHVSGLLSRQVNFGKYGILTLSLHKGNGAGES